MSADNSNIHADEVIIGSNTVIDPSAIIRGVAGRAKKVVIGDNSYIGADVQIICDDVSIGDYCKIHHHTNIHGYRPCRIGHNAWIGQYTIIDSIGGTTIGNNCGIGAHSQLWSHIKFGDTLEGCRFLSDAPLLIGNDVWFAGHCIVSPITAADKSMALAGSVVTSDMAANQVYAGAPAKSISAKIGNQFEEVPVSEKLRKMKDYVIQWGGDSREIRVIEDDLQMEDPENHTYFNVRRRTYNKRGTPEEVSLMKFLLPEKAKFVPR
jgi:acetyltransferase-like isoleucine patch superfamily enzyme